MRNKKSNSLLVASRLIGYIGVFACMLGTIIYLLMLVNNPDGAPFDPMNLYIIAALAVVFVGASLALRIASNHAALETVDDLDVVEVAMDGTLESDDEEAEDDEVVGEAIEEETAEEGASLKSKLQLTPEKKEKIVKVVKKNAPVILAVVATAAVSVALHNSAKNRQRARVRRNFLDLFY